MNKSGLSECSIELLSSENIEETEASISVSISGGEDLPEGLVDLTAFADSNPSHFSYFTCSISFNTDKADVSLFNISTTGLKKTFDESQLPDEFQELNSKVPYYIEESKFSDLYSSIRGALEPASDCEFVCTFSVKKQNLADDLRDIADLSDDVNILLWSSPDGLINQLRNSGLSDMSSSLFSSDAVSLFVFFDLDQSINSGLLRTFSYSEFIQNPSIDVPPEKEFLEALSWGSDLERQCLSPLIFNSNESRQLFTPLVLYSFVSTISDSYSQIGTSIEFEIQSSKGQIKQNIDIFDNELNDQDLTEIYRFFAEFSERGERTVYRELWHRAIVEHCDGLEDIPRNRNDISIFYHSLEEKAINGNFDELSSAVQDAQVFIGDVTNTLSESTVNLSSEIQKVLAALFGIGATTIFILLRAGGVESAAVFSLIALPALVTLYFPTAQERINELSDIVDEGKKDAELYSDIASSVGAGQLVDISRFEDRHESYVKLAKRRVNWANKRLEYAFQILCGIWLIIGLAVIVTFPIHSYSFYAPMLTVPVAVFIRINHENMNYHEPIVPFIPYTTTLIVAGLAVAYATEFIV